MGAAFLLAFLAVARAGVATAATHEAPHGAKEVRSQAQDLIKADQLTTARKVLKIELERLRQLAKRAAGPAADAVEAASQIPYMRLGSDDAKGAADLLTELGGVYQRLGKQSEALAVLEEAADLTRALYGSRDPRYGLTADRLADAHVQNGSPAVGFDLYRKLIDVMKKGLGRTHPGYQLTLRKMADAASAAGKHKAADKAYAELLSLMDQEQAAAVGGGNGGASSSSDDSSSSSGGGGSGGDVTEDGDTERRTALAGTRVRHAHSLASAGKLEEALAVAEQARDMYADSDVTRGSLDHAASLNGVAGILERLGRYDEAIEAMTEAYELAKAIPDVPSQVVDGAKRNLDGLTRHIARKRRRESLEL